MMEKDFYNLLTAVAEVFDVPRAEILMKNKLSAAKARWFVAHCIYHGHVHLRNLFMKMLDVTSQGFYQYAYYADKAIYECAEDLCLMNEIRAKVGLPKLKRAVTHKDKISNTKTLFGFEYTQLDALRFLNACRGAKEYMKKLCSIGRQPIPDGMVYSPLRPRRDYKSWYNE